jgi:hypothetical protein
VKLSDLVNDVRRRRTVLFRAMLYLTYVPEALRPFACIRQVHLFWQGPRGCLNVGLTFERSLSCTKARRSGCCTAVDRKRTMQLVTLSFDRRCVPMEVFLQNCPSSTQADVNGDFT